MIQQLLAERGPRALYSRDLVSLLRQTDGYWVIELSQDALPVPLRFDLPDWSGPAKVRQRG